MSFAWRWWVGIEPEHEHYREKVRRVLDAGMPLARYRGELDAEARKVHVSSDRQGRIESDLLHRLRLQHFLLFPSLILWPLVGIFAAIISIPMMPLLKLVEWILIKKKALSAVAIIIQRYTRWEIIGIPRLDDGSKQFGKALASIHRMPTTVFLGLFAYLIVSYSPMSSFNVLLLSALVYIILVSAISVIRAATESTLTFADPTNRRIIPMESYVDEKLGPWVGVGLIFLLSRQLMYGSKIRTGELLIDPVPFSISVLLVLYTATIIGITVEILFFRSRGEEVRMTFQKQMVDIFQPDVYLFNRNLGTLRLVPLMPLSLWLETDEDYDDLLKDT
ncbi:MAG TPA: hypothetical protein D7H77_03560 [Candidatus Poseidoniales archaeon]|nr:hypothetical protein [Euryarchaeota archaeon]DAC11886.1 MAG TPA: hypothetical protein D7H77_03560 [Candidatus Poseidoniales archaeon]